MYVNGQSDLELLDRRLAVLLSKLEARVEELVLYFSEDPIGLTLKAMLLDLQHATQDLRSFQVLIGVDEPSIPCKN